MRLFNRKPVNPEPVYAEGMPYLILSKPVRGRRASPYIEAVDPYGNQVILRADGDGFVLWDRTYLPKGSLESMRRVSPRMAERLDTDYGGEEAAFPGGRTVVDDRKFLIDDTWFCRISTWKRQGKGYRLLDTSNYVVTESRALSMRPKGPERGFMEISDPLTGTTGFRIQNVYRDEVSVREYVRTDNADRFFASEPPRPVGVGA